MGETTPPSRMGLRHSGGEIVEVQGGHIVRSTGRKDRHSKVCTAKGPRDRRVRLSAHTAIQFYDVQDRLGYDRPSKAVDWLIKKAKAAIDELEELPAWTPTSGWAAANSNSNSVPILPGSSSGRRGTTSTTAAMLVVGDDVMEMGNHSHNNPPNCENNNDNSSSFLPQSMDSDAIADTIKSFFPMGGSAAVAVGSTNSSPMQFQGFQPPDLRQDLRLSLQSFDDQILFHHHNQPPPPQQQQQSATHQTDLFGGIGFDAPSAAGWPEHQRMVAWNAGGDGGGGGGGGGFIFNSPPLLQPFLFSQNNNQFVSQRGPLQSSNTQSIRAWIDHPSSFSAATASVDHHHYHHHQNLPVYPSSLGGFPGFRIPARIQGEEEEHDGISDKPSSASSDSRH